jgi:hypothetical protein
VAQFVDSLVLVMSRVHSVSLVMVLVKRSASVATSDNCKVNDKIDSAQSSIRRSGLSQSWWCNSITPL